MCNTSPAPSKTLIFKTLIFLLFLLFLNPDKCLSSTDRIFASPQILTFTVDQWGVSPPYQTVQIYGQGKIVRWVAWYDVGWIKLMPSSGSCPGILRVGVGSYSHLGPGIHTGNITIQGEGSWETPRIQIRAQLVIANGVMPALGVYPKDLKFWVRKGMSPQTKYITISNQGTGSFNFTAWSQGDWIQVEPGSGRVGSRQSTKIKVTVIPKEYLRNDIYKATVTIQATWPTRRNQQYVSVYMYLGITKTKSKDVLISDLREKLKILKKKVSDVEDTLQLHPNSLTFVIKKWGNIPAPQKVEIKAKEPNTSVKFECLASESWIKIFKYKNTTPTKITIGVSPDWRNLKNNKTYTGIVYFKNRENKKEIAKKIVIKLKVDLQEFISVLKIKPEKIEFNPSSKKDDWISKKIEVTTQSLDHYEVSIKDSPSWLKIKQTGRVTPCDLIVEVNTKLLKEEEIYEDEIILETPNFEGDKYYKIKVSLKFPQERKEGIPLKLQPLYTNLTFGSQFFLSIIVGEEKKPVLNLKEIEMSISFSSNLKIQRPLSENIRTGKMLANIGRNLRFSLDNGGKINCVRLRIKTTPFSNWGELVRIRFKILKEQITKKEPSFAYIEIKDVQAKNKDLKPIKFWMSPLKIKIKDVCFKIEEPTCQVPNSSFWTYFINLEGEICDISYLRFSLKIDKPALVSKSSEPISALIGENQPYLDEMLVDPVPKGNGLYQISINFYRPTTIVEGRFGRIKLRISKEARYGERINLRIINVYAKDSIGNRIGISSGDTILKIGGISVYPGDADNSGRVDENDILPLAMFWHQEGPERDDKDITVFCAKLAMIEKGGEKWEKRAAIYADTDGNGRVDAKDIIAISLHFGKTQPKILRIKNLKKKAIKFEPAIIAHPKYRKAFEEMLKELEKNPKIYGSSILIKRLKSLTRQTKTRINTPIISQKNLKTYSCLFQSYPNPFYMKRHLFCKIPFKVDEADFTQIQIKIYNLSGELVKIIGPESFKKDKQGLYEAEWNGKNDEAQSVSSGIYFYQLITPYKVLTKSMLLIK